MSRAKLFVKSKRTAWITGHVSVESMGAAHTTTDYAEGSTVVSLSQDDAWANNLLKRAGLQFDLIDLSRGIGTRLKGTLNRINKTPTLIVESRPSKRYIGVREISQFLSDSRNQLA